MRPMLLAAAPGAGAALALAGYAGLQAGPGPYAPLAGAEPAFEPRVIEPLVDPPDIEYPYHDTFGYLRAEHGPSDDSVTITYIDRTAAQAGGRCAWPFCGTDPGATGGTHTMTYLPGQTFAYACADHGDRTRMHMYQYRGTGEFRGARTFTLVRFELEVPRGVPCAFPGYLERTVDVFDGGRLGAYDLGPRRDPPEGPRAADREVIGRAVPVTPLSVDPYTLEWVGQHRGFEGWIWGIAHNADGSITVEYRDERGAGHAATCEPGQTFLASCKERGGVALLAIYSYRGLDVAEYYGRVQPALVAANFKAHTPAPLRCAYPDAIGLAADACDAGRLDAQYDMLRMSRPPP